MFDATDFFSGLTGWFLGLLQSFLLDLVELLFSGPPSLLD